MTVPDSACPLDNHAASCRCHLGGAIMVDIPYAHPENQTLREKMNAAPLFTHTEGEGLDDPEGRAELTAQAQKVTDTAHALVNPPRCTCWSLPGATCQIHGAPTPGVPPPHVRYATREQYEAAMEAQVPRARAGQILAEAAETVGAGGDRHRDYGDAIDNFTAIGKLWAVVLGLDEITPEQVAICSAMIKMGRLIHSPGHRDSWVDGAGYLALGGDIAGTPGRHP